MFYAAELRFLQNVLQKHRTQTMLIDPQCPIDPRIDFGLRQQLGMEEDYEKTIRQTLLAAQPNIIYRLTDPFRCSFLFLRLPEASDHRILLVGPYLDIELTHEQLLEQTEHTGISPQQFRRVENFYASIPVFANEGILLSLVESFGEYIWGGVDKFRLSNLNQEMAEAITALPADTASLPLDNPEHDMKMIEARYSHEADLMEAVSRGLLHKAEQLFSGFSPLSFERRAEPVRNMKNYCIIMNTLLRKAAQNGSVHPFYLDEVSSIFAVRIESLTSINALQNLMSEMLRSYCRLVRSHTAKGYSSPVQKTIIRIDSNLDSDLTLKALAEAQGLNASYLSSLFKKETGQTITEFVNQKRVYKAKHLLKTTKLQVQTIALHCGIPDVNYFSKIFKKHTGKTPKEYRKQSVGLDLSR